MLIYATQEIEDMMNHCDHLPAFASQARRFIFELHQKYAPSNVYNPKTFDHLKEIEVRKLFADTEKRKQDGLKWGEILAL